MIDGLIHTILIKLILLVLKVKHMVSEKVDQKERLKHLLFHNLLKVKYCFILEILEMKVKNMI